MTIEKARKNDAELLTALTLRSKDYWNYGAEQIAAWKAELRLTEQYLEAYPVYKLMLADALVGFYAYEIQNTTTTKLNFLFVDPKYIGKGYGKVLLSDFLNRMALTPCERVILDADPHAEKFYRQQGFRVIGQLKSSIKDRFLPVMELKLK